MKYGKKLIVIIGATRGLGKSLYELISTVDSEDVMLLNKEKIDVKSGVKQEIIDLSKDLKEEKIMKLIDSVSLKYDKICLVNNASIIHPIKKVGDIDNCDFLKSFNINFLNFARIINLFIGKSNNFSELKILNISSGAASSPHHGLAVYCSSKSALEMFTQCVYIELKDNEKVKVLAFRPGVIDTEMQKEMRGTKNSDFEKVEVYKMLRRKGGLLKPEYVAKKIHNIINSNKYWLKPILDISDLK